jgi:outer membrane protein assembly factor BamB
MIGVRILAVSALATLAACDTWFGDTWFGDTKPPLPGARVSVLQFERQIEPDPTIANVPVRLPRPVVNRAWPQSGGEATHAMYHLDANDDLKIVWRADIGTGTSYDRRLLAPPVVAEGKAFALDASGRVTAFDAESGRRLWSVSALGKDDDDDPVQPGGIAYADGRLYVATGLAFVAALSADDGKEIWRQQTGSPVRSAPTAAGGRVLAITVDNQTVAMDAADGTRRWQHAGIPETAGLLGGSSPAIDGGTVVVAYSSGEVFALRLENGRGIWSDALIAVRRSDAVSSLADIRGNPVIDRDLVLAVSNSGRTAAIDLRSGARIWESDVGGVEAPWTAGDFVYVLSNDNDLICFVRRDGRVRWVTSLGRYRDEAKRRDPLLWYGPVLVGDRLIVAGHHGELLAVSPYDGRPLGRLEIPSGTSVAPIVADRTVYVLTDRAQLLALR